MSLILLLRISPMMRLRYGRIESDAWDAEILNLIEAKGSTSREDIGMAAGQFFDYAFHMRQKFGDPNEAVLLPREAAQDDMTWLDPPGHLV